MSNTVQPFVPDNLPLKELEWHYFVDLMGLANRKIALYDGLLQTIPNPDVLLSPLKSQEAVLSSKIEGTQATIEEVMEHEADGEVSEAKKGDIFEIINYRNALFRARTSLDQIPLSLRIVKDMHSTLLSGVRGHSKDPGNFRRIQNWIGTPGSTIENARFIPPTVQEMKEALNNWELYLHYEEKDVLVQLAIVHAQFEIIHPFMDGNGRIGRILIPLFLFHKSAISQPVFYMSDYLETNRKAYYDALRDITENGNWNNWIRFFLGGVIWQAEKNIIKVREIIELYNKTKSDIVDLTHSQFAVQCLDYIFTTPIFSSTHFLARSGIPRASSMRLVRAMESGGILTCISRGTGRRPSRYAFRPLMEVINK